MAERHKSREGGRERGREEGGEGKRKAGIGDQGRGFVAWGRGTPFQISRYV